MSSNSRKHIIFSLLIVLFLSCKSKAQNIIPIYNGPDSNPDNMYRKDVDSNFNPFVGEWKWEQNDNSLTIEFQKKEMVPIYQGNDYQDYLIGAYRYEENNTELVNTFPLNLQDQNIEENSISGWNITTLNKGFPPCPECTNGTRFIRLHVDDPSRPGLWGVLVMAHFVENGIEKVRMRIWNTYNENSTSEYTGPTNITIPEGVYTLIKQN